MVRPKRPTVGRFVKSTERLPAQVRIGGGPDLLHDLLRGTVGAVLNRAPVRKASAKDLLLPAVAPRGWAWLIPASGTPLLRLEDPLGRVVRAVTASFVVVGSLGYIYCLKINLVHMLVSSKQEHRILLASMVAILK